MMEPLMEQIGNMFIPAEDPNGAERRKVAEQPVVIFKPRRKVIGMTFVVTAANIPLQKYSSIIAALTSADHVVVGYFINVLNPPSLQNHRFKAQLIPKIFQEVKDEFQVQTYSIVGHSIGGKIALLVAALYDEAKQLQSIIALDPVDQSPVEFTHDSSLKKALSSDASASSAASERSNLSLESSKADITVTFTDTGYFVGKKHNAREIQRNNPSIKLVMHRNSCHMVYCDEGGLLSWKALMGRGKSAERNQVIRDETIQLIKDRALRSSIVGNASDAVLSSVGKVKKTLADGMDDLKQMSEEAQTKGKAMAGASQMFSIMG